MGAVENAPLNGGPAEGVGKALEYGIAVLAAIAVPTECSQRRAMGSVVGAGESAFRGERLNPGIGQTSTRQVSRRRTSASLRGSALSWPMRTRLSSAGWDKVLSDQRQNGLGEDAIDEGVRLGKPIGIFFRSIAIRVDLAHQLRFRRQEEGQDLAQGQIVANQQEVYIAAHRVAPLATEP